MKIMASGPIISWQIDGEKWKQWQTLFSWAPKSLQMVTAAMKLKDNCSLKEKLWQTFTAFWKQRCHFADKGPYSQTYGFSSSQVRMWELDHREGWMLMNWCFQILVLEKTLERSLDSKIKLVNPKENQPWIFTGRTDAGAEAPILWPPDAKSWLIGKDPDGGKDWEQAVKGVTEDEMVGWHHWLNGHEFAQTPQDIVKDREAWSAADHGPWDPKKLDSDWVTEQQ